MRVPTESSRGSGLQRVPISPGAEQVHSRLAWRKVNALLSRKYLMNSRQVYGCRLWSSKWIRVGNLGSSGLASQFPGGTRDSKLGSPCRATDPFPGRCPGVRGRPTFAPACPPASRTQPQGSSRKGGAGGVWDVGKVLPPLVLSLTCSLPPSPTTTTGRTPFPGNGAGVGCCFGFQKASKRLMGTVTPGMEYWVLGGGGGSLVTRGG